MVGGGLLEGDSESKILYLKPHCVFKSGNVPRGTRHLVELPISSPKRQPPIITNQWRTESLILCKKERTR